MLRLPAILTLAALLVAVPATTALAASSGIAPVEADETPSPTAPAGTTWALQPATADGPDGRVSLRHVVDAGGTVDDLLALTNFGAEPASFAVYASDGTITVDGNFDLIPSDRESVDGGSWITLGAIEGSTPRDGGGMIVSVPAQATVAVPVRISAPAVATPGDHPAGVVAEYIPGDSSSVQLASRVGVRAHIRVSGDLVPALVTERVSATYSPSWNPFVPGRVTLTYAIVNAGNVRLGTQTVTTLGGPFGIAASATNGELREVLPGQASTTTVEIETWPTFFSWGDIVSTPAPVGEDVIEGSLTAETVPFTVWTVPWAQLLLVALLVGMLLLARALRMRSAKRVQDRIDAAVAAATAASGAAAEPALSDSEPTPSTSP